MTMMIILIVSKSSTEFRIVIINNVIPAYRCLTTGANTFGFLGTVSTFSYTHQCFCIMRNLCIMKVIDVLI